MDIENLIHMGNQIASFYEAYPDQVEARKEIATHLKKFWAPRMRTQLLQYVDNHQGKELSEGLLASVREHRELIGP
jgi:formate dehydrogenase subunit delta